MSSRRKAAGARTTSMPDIDRLREQYGCGPIHFTGTPADALVERHLLFDDVLDPNAVFSDHFSRNEPGAFAPLRDALLTGGDHYMHLADLTSYLDADRRLEQLYTDGKGWARKAILNVAASGKFSSDRTIAEYAAEIWDARPCPVPWERIVDRAKGFAA